MIFPAIIIPIIVIIAVNAAITTNKVSALQYELLTNNVNNIISKSEADFKTVNALGMWDVTFYRDATKKGILQSIGKNLAPDTSVAIFDTSINKIIYSIGADDIKLLMTTDHIQSIASQKELQNEITVTTNSGKMMEVLVVKGAFPRLNWIITSFVNKEQVFKFTNEAMTLSIIIGTLLLLIILIVISLLSNRFTKAVVALEEGAHQLSTEGEYDKINLPGSDEFSSLANSFNRMAAEIRYKEQLLKQSITEEQKANAALLESRNLYHDLIENTPDIITKVDLEGRFRFINRAAAEMFGVSAKDCIGKPAFDFVLPDDQQSTRKAFALWVKSDENVFIYENRQMGIDRKIYYITWSIYREFDKNNQCIGFASTGVDATDYKQSLIENAALESQLIQANKMEAVGELAGGVAHDFNNMLGVILGHAQIALKRTEPSSPSIQNLEGILKAGRHSADLTKQLLTFARKQNIEPEIIYLNESVSSMISMLKRLIGENIQLNFEQADTLWPIKVDSSQINQILVNLCVNARDAIQAVGEISISTKNYTIDNHTIKRLNNEEYNSATKLSVEPHLLPAGDYVKLSISDNGEGMDKDVKSHIFEPFFTTKGVGEGTGLGLSTVFGAIKQNNGFIELFSEPNKGTSFHIYFLREGNAVVNDSEVIMKQNLFGNETVLVVEDDKMLLAVEIIMLEEYGYQVLSAETIGRAIELAQQHVGQIDLLLTDIVMPEMNGKELATKLTASCPKMKVLYMSGYTDNIIAEQSILNGDVHFLSKPFESEELAAKLRDVLESTVN